MEDTHLHALDYVSVLRRRKWWLIAPIALSIVVGLALVQFLPKQYRSSATLGVTAPVVSPNLVSQSAPFDNQERLRAVTQQLMSVPILARVVREEKLGSGTLTEAQLATLRKAITITVPDPVANTSEPRHLDLFVVNYADSEAVRAQQIANRIVTVFVDENSKVRAQHAEDTSVFIGAQLRASQARLAELESRLRKAKESYMGRLPEQTTANLQTLSGLRQQVESNATALRSEQDRLSMLERQVDTMKESASAIAAKTGDALPIETRVATLEHDLAEAKATYTDRHPEVVRLTAELADAKKSAAALRQRPEADRLAQLQTDPAYRQLTADRELSRLRVRDLQRSATTLQQQIGQYQSRVEAAPMVEQQLATVQRDFDLEKTQYNELSSKLRSAGIVENIERNRGGEQFTVLYPASLPTEPVRPIPLRVMLVSVLAGICLGGALMLGREYFDRSIHNAREVKEELALPVLGEIAHIPA